MLNTSGCEPVAYLVLIRMDPIEETYGGGIVQRNDVALERDRLAITKGVCIAIGPTCWQHDGRGPQGELVPRCAIGGRVVIEQWVGQYFEGPDKHHYRMVTDRNIIGRVIPSPTEGAA